MRFLALIFLPFVSINLYCQYSLNKVDSIVISKKYKSIDVKELSGEIAMDFKSDSNKIRAFYFYVVNNIKYDKKLSERVWYPTSKEDMDSITISEVNNCIKTKKGICWDYSALFQKLCFYQGIDVELITGTLRNNATMPQNRQENHGWNSLIINGKRKFIDCTFDPPENYSKYEYDKFYLVDPEEFIYRCLPIDSPKQYLKTAITYDQFKTLTYTGNAFFEHKIKNLSPNSIYLKIKSDAKYLISFKVTNIDKLISIEIYLNDILVKTNEDIKLNSNLNLNLMLVPGDIIKIMAISRVSQDDHGVIESIAPLITYIAK